MNVWIFQTGEPLHIDYGNPRPMRAMNLANMLIEKGHSVVIWSSGFYHQEKRHRCHEVTTFQVSSKLIIRLIPSPGYQRNVGLGRIFDHAVLAMNLKKLLSTETSLPDVAFVGYPPIEAAAVLTKWLANHSIPCVLDVKDQWPTFFLEAMPRVVRPIGRIILQPYFYLARRAMRDVSGLISMTDAFLQWAIKFSNRNIGSRDLVVPLTSPADQVTEHELKLARQWWDEFGVANDGRNRVCFVGSHSPAFDFLPIYEAARGFLSAGLDCEFVICGDGGVSAEVRKMMSALPNVRFPGWIDRAQIQVLAERSIAWLAPYKNIDNFTLNLPNKIIDALALGLPILSPLQGEVERMIQEHRVGLTYGVGVGESLFSRIQTLIKDPCLQFEQSKNARQLFANKYLFDVVYDRLVEHLESLACVK